MNLPELPPDPSGPDEAGVATQSPAAAHPPEPLAPGTLWNQMNDRFPEAPDEIPPEARLRLEDEIPRGEFRRFTNWIEDLLAAEGPASPAVEALREGWAAKLPSFVVLKEDLREARQEYRTHLKAMRPLLEEAAAPGSSDRGPRFSISAALWSATGDSALQCLMCADRVRNLRARIAFLSELLPAHVAALARESSGGSDPDRLAQAMRESLDLS